VPVAAALTTLLVLEVTGAAGRDPAASVMFCVAAFAIGSVAQEIWRGTCARRSLSGEATLVALASLMRRNRRRYGGYVVHVGFVLLLVGVAASSAFQHASDVRLRPGQTARLGGYDIRYVTPTSSLDAAKVSLGAVLDVSSHGRHVATLTPSRDYYTSLDEGQFGRIGRFFEGDSTSELGLRSGVGRDIWTAVQPDLTPVGQYIRDANRRFPDANAALEGFLVKTIVTRYVRGPAAAQFRLIVSPLVAWIWIGGVIAVGGAMIAIWPAPSVARRRAAVTARAPLANRAD
jgi:cytochrome c-type biogenesis protein CcmF